jgi:hypothetical protein
LDLLEGVIPEDHCHQVSARDYIDQLFQKKTTIGTVLDLGCGAGDSYDYFKVKNPQDTRSQWVFCGIDLSSGTVSFAEPGELYTLRSAQPDDGIRPADGRDPSRRVFCLNVHDIHFSAC